MKTAPNQKNNPILILIERVNPVLLKNLWLAPLFSVISLYGIAAIYGYWYFRSQSSILFLKILGLGIASYTISFFVFNKSTTLKKFATWSPKIKINSDLFIFGSSVIYFAIICYALLTTKQIAFFLAFSTHDAERIALAREMLFKMRTGWEQILLYGNTLVSSALMPYAITLSYIEKKKYRYILLTLFILSLLPTLEKALIVKALLPLIILGFNRYISPKSTVAFILVILGIVYFNTTLTKQGHINASNSIVSVDLETRDDDSLESPESYPITGKSKIMTRKSNDVTKQNCDELMKDWNRLSFIKKMTIPCVPAKYSNNSRFELFSTDVPISFVMNRILWIPYVTAYDWILYFETRLNGQFLNGRSSLVGSLLTGQKQFKMDQAVFSMEFANGTASTGSANAVYLVDAFVNFSWVGVIIYNIFLALITWYIGEKDNYILKSCYYYFIYVLASGSMLGVLFSNGLFLFLFCSIFLDSPGPADIFALKDKKLTPETWAKTENCGFI